MQQEELIHKDKEQLPKHLFDVEKLREEDLQQISSLIKQYPYCQSLYLLAVRSALKTPLYQQYLTEAATITPSRNVLYNIVHHPEKFSLHHQDKEYAVETQPVEDTLISTIAEDSKEESLAIADDVPVSAEADQKHNETVYDEITPLEVPLVNEDENHSEEIENLNLDGESYSEEPAEAGEIQYTGYEEEKSAPEIEEQISLVSEEESKKEVITEAPYIETLGDEEYFSEQVKDNIIEEQQVVEGENTSLPMLKSADVFRYHEERLPYTFLWWLNKTRKEYQNIRPYATFRLDTSKAIKKQEEEIINYQIAENIFHLTSADELEKAGSPKTVAFDFMRKEHQIIERFIKEEPHITPPQANKIDTENKAKRSSEDNSELVSETLAKVYVEQMLYHKALDIYRKLSLKYPEKNAYFASQIKYLELKVN